MVYPVTIGGDVRAVLFTGQIVFKDDERVARIKANIEERCDRRSATRFADSIDKERHRQWGKEPNYAKKSVVCLREFGDMLQKIVDNLYDARKDTATRVLLQECADFLTAADLNLCDSIQEWNRPRLNFASPPARILVVPGEAWERGM